MNTMQLSMGELVALATALSALAKFLIWLRRAPAPPPVVNVTVTIAPPSEPKKRASGRNR